MSKLWGATPEEWDHFAFGLNLWQDLLPVVCNPNAEVQANSKLKAIGKTPSRYYNGKVGGIKDWTKLIATPDMIEYWQDEQDYGICVQTRHARAIDVDLSKDYREEILHVVASATGSIPAIRYRSNSTKFLLIFFVSGEFPKRIINVGDERIEFLANGQQFVAVGTHTSGVHYEWEGGLGHRADVSEIEYHDIFDKLGEHFKATTSSTSLVVRGSGPSVAIDDPVADYIYRANLAMEESDDENIYITCPWKAEHTTDSGYSETVYFRAGSRGYDRGHFKCQHSHCAGRSDDEYLGAIGYIADGFDVLPPEVSTEQIQSTKVSSISIPALLGSLPGFGERTKKGEIEPRAHNIKKALQRPDFCGIHIGRDMFRDEIMFAPHDQPGAWRRFTDADYSKLEVLLQQYRSFGVISFEILKRMVRLVADENQFDSAQLWLNSLRWDGVPRIDSFFSNYFGASDTDYVRAAGAYFWTGSAGRIIEPGCQADMVVVLIGEQQGEGKSSGIAAIAPHIEFFVEIDLQDKDADNSRKLRGVTTVELSELRGIITRASEGIKAFITRRYEVWTPKYQEFITRFMRRCMFIGSTNEREFLSDSTGNRRWLPIMVNRQPGVATRITADRNQLWAEAAERFVVTGVEYEAAERLAQDVHADHMITDPWEAAVERYLDELPPDVGIEVTPRETNALRMEDALRAMGLDVKNYRSVEYRRVAAIFCKLGYRQVQKWHDGKNLRVWSKS